MTSSEVTAHSPRTSIPLTAVARVLAASEPAAVLLAARCLVGGGLVVVPTETFYGIAALPDHPEALKRLVALKERPDHKALTLLAAGADAVTRCAALEGTMQTLAHRFWPGALTLVLPVRADLDTCLVTQAVSADDEPTVAVRVSEHFFARELAREVGGLMTGTSANRAGERPPKTIDELDPRVLSEVDLVIDGGELAGGLPSTLIGQSEAGIVIYRAGALDAKKLLAEALGPEPA